MERLPDDLAHAYLELLDVDARDGSVDAPTLAALQRAHVERVPYETVDIVRGAPPGIDRLACARRIVAGRGGYCYHLNGAFSALLEWLGVDVTRHRAGVQGRDVAAPPGATGNHLGLTVRTPEGARWLVDVGLGTGPRLPLPLAEGGYEQNGFRYALRPSPLVAGGWRFDHDERCGFLCFDIDHAAAVTGDFLAMHADLSTGRFAGTATVQRWRDGRLEVLRGCVHTEIGSDGTTSLEVTDQGEWWELVTGHFGLAYGGLAAAEKAALWGKVLAGHRAWDAAGRP